MDARLHKAALKGDVPSLLSLLDEDALILDRATAVAETPLHVAALFGHSKFAEEIVSRKPELVRKLNSEQSSPLHLASAKGHIEMVKVLLEYDTDMCLVRDQDGRTPFHVAAMKGRVEVVKVLIGKNGTAARVLSRQREPILHFCVNHGQFVIVRELLQSAENDEEGDFINMKDDDDNTILHLAVAKKHIPLTKFLLQKTRMREKVNALNVHGFTAMDVLQQNRDKSKDMKLQGLLQGAQAKRAKAMHRNRDDWTIQTLSPRKNRCKKHMDWLNETRNVLIVVAVLIATVTFQAGINPPGGFWQDDKLNAISPVGPSNPAQAEHIAGESIMATNFPHGYILFSTFNVIGFVASLGIILLLISGFTAKKRIFMWTLMITTWLSLSSMLITYGLVSIIVTPGEISNTGMILISLFGWLLLNGLLFAVHFFRLIRRLSRKLTTLIYTCIYRNKKPSMDPTNVNVGYIDVESHVELN